MLGGAPAWVLKGATLDYAFAKGWYYQQGKSNNPSQLLTCSRASSGYAQDLAGNWYLFANNVPRITNQGLLVEEARTNSIRNNSMQGAVAGSPGTLPTNWNYANVVGTTTQIVGIGTENGIDYIDIRFSGTPNASTTLSIQLEASTTIAASNGQSWAMSLFYYLSAGSLTNVGVATPLFNQRNAGGSGLGNLAGSSVAIATTGTLGTNRISFTATTNQATIAFVTPQLQVGVTSGLAIDFTIRIGWPQLELGAFASSAIRTTSAAVTRAADVVTVTRPPVFGNSPPSAFVQITPSAPTSFTSNQFALCVSDGTTANRFNINRGASPGLAAASVNVVNSATVALNSVAALAQGAQSKLAVAFGSNDEALSLAGAAIVAGAGATPSASMTTIHLGARSDGVLPFDGYISRVAIWPTTRLSNATLQALTQ